MSPRGHAWLALVAAVMVLCAALSGCAGSSNTTSTSPGTSGAGSSPGASGTATTSASSSANTTTSGPTAPGGPSALSVNPASGTPQSVIHFSFTSPAASGSQGKSLISQTLSVVGPEHSGCVGVHDEPVPVAPAGQAVHVAVGPSQLGAGWCPGTYAARVEVLERPKCGEGMMCPQFIRVVAVLGPVTFKIAG
jgi:hypothetical protein